LHDVTGGRPALLCLQNLIKLQPSFDAVLARIVQRTNATLVLFEHSAGQSMRFRRRFARAFAAVAVDIDTQLRIVRALPYAEWLGGVAAATLVLDTPGFSGGVSSLDAISVGTPVVAFAGDSARARQTAAMLKFVDVPDLIAADTEEYVRLAVALFADETRRAELRRRLLANASRLFDNRDAQVHLQEFLLSCV
jgi:protein O-GlcNAc transferase